MLALEIDEIQRHNKRNDCWVVVDDLVYDVTAFLQEVKISLIRSIQEVKTFF